MPLYSLKDLTKIVMEIFLNSKTSETNAAAVSEALVKAEADGLTSHGLARVAPYADQARSGKVDGYAEPIVTDIGTSAVQVDARMGFAYPAINMGLESAFKKVGAAGIVGLSIKNSHHAGVLGHHVERVANEGLMGVGFTNSPSALGPWGGNKAIFGTNPIAFSCPRNNHQPLVIDLSMSKVARGKIVLAASKGETIPEDWAIDIKGRPTTNAKEALMGTMLPFGGAKGAALTLMVEMLSATLTGSNYGFEASSFFTVEGSPPCIGQFFLVINVTAFGGTNFLSRVEILMNEILNQPGTRLPGNRRHLLREKAEREGIEVPENLISDFQKRTNETAL